MNGRVRAKAGLERKHSVPSFWVDVIPVRAGYRHPLLPFLCDVERLEPLASFSFHWVSLGIQSRLD